MTLSASPSAASPALLAELATLGDDESRGRFLAERPYLIHACTVSLRKFLVYRGRSKAIFDTAKR